MLTLIDSLDSLLVMQEYGRFNDAIARMKRDLSFDKDVSVSVFETNIRVLGGLLSAHQLSTALRGTKPIEYDGHFLLDKAVELADRLLPAFDTPTGIPYHVVHLQHGLQRDDLTSKTCPAAGASFLVELGLLSKLTGDDKYTQAAHRATSAIWSRRSKIDLVGSMIDVESGKWVQSHTSIGAGIDSFFETVFKGYVLLGDAELLRSFDTAYAATKKHLLIEGWHVEVDMHQGADQVYSYYFSALQAFWPSLQVIAGHVREAVSAFRSMTQLWYKYKGLPDIYDHKRAGTLGYAKDYPLRPEMIESAYQLFKATGNRKYVTFGRDFLLSLQTANKVECGYAASRDVTASASQLYHKQRQNKDESMTTRYTSSYKKKKLLDDRMDSFFLSETLKYLYLLFDEALPASERESVFCHQSSPPPSKSPMRAGASGHAMCALHDQPGDNNHTAQRLPSPLEPPTGTSWGVLGVGDGSDNPSFTDDLYHCVDLQSVVFSTEGHVMLNSAKLRSPEGVVDDVWDEEDGCGEDVAAEAGGCIQDLAYCPAVYSFS